MPLMASTPTSCLPPRALLAQALAPINTPSTNTSAAIPEPYPGIPAEVSIYEVGPRDGLQNEAQVLPTAQKTALIAHLAAAGLQRIEATSLVSPKWVPQLADAEALLADLQEQAQHNPALAALTLSALCPNEHGLQRALKCGVREIGVFLSASDTHTIKNTNKSREEAVASFRTLVPKAIAAGLRVRGYVSTVWGCPYEGAVPISATVALTDALVEMGCYQVSLGDTIGVGTPWQTREILRTLMQHHSPDMLALHLHDTRGTALANALTGLEMGIRCFDSSIGGLGGCPYAPGASGNLATEELAYMLDGLGVHSGIDLNAVISAAAFAERLLGRTLPSKLLRAGLLVPR
jgi:hydroxymethylglutaryl-CoA lyase